MKLRDLVTTKKGTALAVADDQSKISDDQSRLAADQARLASDVAADAAADAAIAEGLGSGGNGFAIDPTPNADGTFNLLVKDTSPVGYHVAVIPSIDADLASPDA